MTYPLFGISGVFLAGALFIEYKHRRGQLSALHNAHEQKSGGEQKKCDNGEELDNTAKEGREQAAEETPEKAGAEEVTLEISSDDPAAAAGPAVEEVKKKKKKKKDGCGSMEIAGQGNEER